MLIPKHQIPQQTLNTYQGQIDDIGKKLEVIKRWKVFIEKGKILKRKEEQIKDDFIKDIFIDVLGYDYEGTGELKKWNLEKELKTVFDGKKPDASLGYFTRDKDNNLIEDIRAVVEVKGPLINLDKKQNRKEYTGTPVDQGFSYAYRIGQSCKWVIITNFLEIRLYRANDINSYHTFFLSELEQNLVEFHFMLAHQQLFLEKGDSRIETLYHNRQKELKSISSDFYKQYHEHRQILFFTIQKNNPKIPWKKLFAATQKLIDRIIFICFVRDLTLIGNVLDQAENSSKNSFSQRDNIFWQEVLHLFEALDKGYRKKQIPPFNGGLFKPDPIINSLEIRDHEILSFIHFVNQYDFHSQLDVNILGHIFEQSISDLEELKRNIQAANPVQAQVIKDLPDFKISKRKKDGVYYTPDYITRYMVKEAVGGWLNDRKAEILDKLSIEEVPEPTIADYETIEKTPNETILTLRKYYAEYETALATIKVLDPACGSGAFLTQVFDYLYAEWKNVREEKEKLFIPPKKRLVSEMTPMNGFQLEEWRIKKSIIVNNLYGVDLNHESVEITKLSLWLKTANKTESLADLTDNIKQGNSVVSAPKYAGEDAFNWAIEFHDILQKNGFDVIVGNPPYVRQELISEFKPYFKANFQSFDSGSDLMIYFIELSIRLLSKNGYCSLITSNKWFKGSYALPLRKYLSEFNIIQIVDFGDLPVFSDATAYPAITVFKKEKPSDFFLGANINSLDIENSRFFIEKELKRISYENIRHESWSIQGLSTVKLSEKLKINSIPLHEYIEDEVYYGIKTGLNEAFVIDNATKEEIEKSDNISKKYIEPFLSGREVKQYSQLKPTQYLIHIEKQFTFLRKRKENTDAEEWFSKNYPGIYSHLLPYRDKAQKRSDRGDFWWELRACHYDHKFRLPKIVYPNICKRPEFTIDIAGLYFNQKCFFIPRNDLFLLGILNSSVTHFWFTQNLPKLRGNFYEPSYIYFKNFPIINTSKEKKSEIIKSVKSMIELNKSNQELTDDYIKVLTENYPPKSPLSSKLTTSLWSLAFVDVLQELGKSGITIPAKKQKEWIELFHEGAGQAQVFKQKIADTEKEINELVYQLYQLTPEEIELIERETAL